MERVQFDQHIKKEWARKHHRLLRLILDLDLSRDTMLRIIEGVNALLDNPSACMEKTDQYISMLQLCQTETDVIRQLDEAGV